MNTSNCSRCKRKIPVTTVAVASGITTLTVPATFTPETCGVYCLSIDVAFPTDTANTTVNVTNGTGTWTIYRRNGDYFRPYLLPSIIKVGYSLDPARLVIMDMKGRK